MFGENLIWIYLAIVLSLSLFIYKYATQNNDYFIKRGIPALKPILFFGNSGEFFTKQVDLIDFVKKLYNDFPDEKYVMCVEDIIIIRISAYLFMI